MKLDRDIFNKGLWPLFLKPNKTIRFLLVVFSIPILLAKIIIALIPTLAIVQSFMLLLAVLAGGFLYLAIENKK